MGRTNGAVVWTRSATVQTGTVTVLTILARRPQVDRLSHKQGESQNYFPCHKVNAPICKSLWIRASAKWLKCKCNVNDNSTKKQGVSLNSLSSCPLPCLLLRIFLPLDLLQCVLRGSQGEKMWGISTQAPPLTPSPATCYNAHVQMWKDKVSLSQGCRAPVLESHKPAF
jgi:hypothetical protein